MAMFNRDQSVKVQAQELKIPNQRGITHIQTVVRTQSPFFSTLSKILEIFTQRPQISWNLRKCIQIHLIFMAFATERSPIFCLACACFRELLLPQTRSEAGKFYILETESYNLVNTFRCKFNKGDENKILVLQAQPTQ